MNPKYLLAAAALLLTTQAFAMDSLFTKQSCNYEVGECPSDGGGGGGGGSSEMSVFTGSWMYGGSHWESYEDSQGGFDLETTPDGKVKVHFGNAGAFLVKPPPKKSEMKRKNLALGALAPAPTLAQAKKKAEEEAAKAALEKALQEKKAAEQAAAAKAAAEAANKAAGVYSGPPISTTPAGNGQILSGARKKI